MQTLMFRMPGFAGFSSFKGVRAFFKIQGGLPCISMTHLYGPDQRRPPPACVRLQWIADSNSEDFAEARVDSVVSQSHMPHLSAYSP